MFKQDKAFNEAISWPAHLKLAIFETLLDKNVNHPSHANHGLSQENYVAFVFTGSFYHTFICPGDNYFNGYGWVCF